MVVRDGKEVIRSKPLQHYFDCPLQFGAFPEFVEATDTADMADLYSITLKPGDVIVAGGWAGGGGGGLGCSRRPIPSHAKGNGTRIGTYHGEVSLCRSGLEVRAFIRRFLRFVARGFGFASWHDTNCT